MYVCMCVRACVCIYMCVCVYIYIHTHTHTHTGVCLASKLEGRKKFREKPGRTGAGTMGPNCRMDLTYYPVEDKLILANDVIVCSQ